jgi:hypothetical protein
MAAISRPKTLTAKEWRANKGLFTKTVSDASGMGKALDKLDTAWNAVPWNEVDPDQATARLTVRGFDSTYTVAIVNRLKSVADHHAAQVNTVKNELLAVEELARRTGNTWKGNKLVPASSTKYVGQVQSAAKTLHEQVDKLGAGWKARLEAAEVSEKLIWQKLNNQIEARIDQLRDAAQAVQNMRLAADQASLAASQKMHEALNELIPLVGISHDPAHQALHQRLVQLKAGDHSDMTKAWKGLSKNQEVAIPAHNDLRNLAQRLEAAVHGL